MRRGLRVVVLAVLAGVTGMAGIAGVPGVAHAATDATLYASPAGTGDCSSAAAACSLQAAVTEANGDSGDTVVLASGTYTGVALQLNASMSLVAAPGAQPVLDGEGTQTADVIHVNAGPATISGLTVTNGDPGVGNFGSGLTVTGSTFEGNGNGLDSIALTTVTRSTFSSNDGGIDVEGGSMTVTNSTVTASGEGLEVGSGTVTVTGSTFSDNNIGVAREGGSAILGSSLIVGSTQDDCVGSGAGGAHVTDAG
jgi:trimeric autotransporter adhesin